MNTVKALWTKKYSLVMIKDKTGGYTLTATYAIDREPFVMVNTKDYDYATRLYDNMLENLTTI